LLKHALADKETVNLLQNTPWAHRWGKLHYW